MKPGGYIKRYTRLKARRDRKRRSARQRDTEYMLRVKQLPCCAYAPSDPACYSAGKVIHAHHAGQRAGGRKADDDTCIPLCEEHHRNWHDARGRFYGWTRDQRRTWADARIAETRAKLARPRGAYEELSF